MNADSETRALERAIHRSKVERARSAPAGSTLFAGAMLFDQVRARMLCGIRSQFPAWSEAEVDAEFCRRLAARREREGRGIYTPVTAVTDR
jgi:hypothetical protein